MSTLRIDLLDDTGAFEPGGTVEGVVSWSLDDVPRTAVVGLVWSTDGKGTCDAQVVRSVTFDDPAPSDSRTFRFDLPSAPWSFSGTLITLAWAIELKVTPARGAAIVERRAIVVSPTRAEIDLKAVRSNLFEGDGGEP